MQKHFSWAKPILNFVLISLVLLSLSRVLLTFWLADRVQATEGLGFILLQGLRFDVVLLSMLIALPIAILPITSLHRLSLAVSHNIVKFYFVLAIGTLTFIELATPNFILQYDTRPNILFLEYLVYPKEVASMLIKAYPMQLLGATIVTGLIVIFTYKHFHRQKRDIFPSIIWSAPLLAILGLMLCVAGARSTLGHRPVNPSTVAFSSDSLINSLPLNSSYSALYALYEKIRYEKTNPDVYGKLPADIVINTIKQNMYIEASQFTNAEIPTLHKQTPTVNNEQTRPKNLVIILEESLGADFVGKLGGADLTPNLDELANEGIWFENLYATGTRSVRGIEAVITGFLPTPARSVVKLGGSQKNFFSIASLLKNQGYQTSFIYGGEAHFDNMKRFFSNNGFSTIIEQKDFQNPKFVGSWGASDEDLLTKANQTFEALNTINEPFFSLVFTSSNHSPFEYPEGRITQLGDDKHTVQNAVKYTDYALGQFIADAKKSSYWENTIFLIIADHSDRVYGNELVPINKFHIPGLFLGGSIIPTSISRVCSQIDMIPTALSLMGVTSEHPAIGIDLTRPDIDAIQGRAIMQYNANQAYMEDKQVIIFQKEKDVLQFSYENKVLEPAKLDPALHQKALGHAIWPMMAYKNKSYRLPANQ